MRAGGGGEGGARASLASLVAHHRSTRYDEALSGFAAGAWRGTRRRRLMMQQERGKQAGKPRKSTGPATTWAPTGSGASEPPPSPLPARRAAEKIMADLQRLLEEKDFSSIEEANHFLEELMASGGGQIPTGGRSARADKLLREALEENARVPAYLLGEKDLTERCVVPILGTKQASPRDHSNAHHHPLAADLIRTEARGRGRAP